MWPPMLNDLSTPFAALATRRSGKPRDLVAPGPSREEIDRILAVAARTPDHGKLAPWRFAVVGDDRREALAAVLTEALRADKPDAAAHEIEAAGQFARQAPALIVMLSSPRDAAIPRWEQELSAGAAGMNLLHAGHALGYAGGWLTGWPAYSTHVRDAFGAAPERIVGFFFLGTPARALDERPRPDMAAIVTDWRG
jgi:nitroreductase